MLARIPLEAFRVFDAACRFMNFSRAGRELHITQAAVSRRIRTLEEHLGARLFTRRGRNIALTPEGERLFQRVRATLEYLEESLEPFSSGNTEIISVSASSSVSHLWLARRLKDFSGDGQDVSVRLLTTDSPAELASEANDLVILYATGAHPRWDLTLLMKEVLAPVASPDYIARRNLDPASITPTDLTRLELIDYERFNAHWISFRQWFNRIGATVRPPQPRLSFSTYSLAIDAAVQGEGIALGSLALLAPELQAGRLIRLGLAELETGYGYYLGTPRYRTLPPAAARLQQHLLSSQ